VDKIGQNFGIVKFANEKEAQEAKTKLDGKEIEKDGIKKKLIVKSYQTQFEQKQFMMNYYSVKSRDQKGNCNLILKNIPLTAKEEDLEKIFKKFGNITSTRIEKNKIESKEEKGKFLLVSKGYGFISFEKPEAAKKALEEMDQKFLPGFEGWNKPLTIEEYLTKKERQLIENQDNINISNYYMSPAPTPVQPFMPIMHPHFMRNQFNNTPMQTPIPMPVPYPFFQFNNYNNYGHYNNFNNNYYQNKRRKGRKFNNYNKNYNNNKNYYRNNQYNKEKNEIEKDMKDLEIDIENKIDIEEYENLETDEDKKNYLGEKVYTAIEESQLAVDKKLSSEDIAKITGMIIAIPDNEIVETVQNSTLFNNRIKEALRLLNK
jgi:RNA recognition motif-containing protein